MTFSNDNLDEDTVASYTCERGFELLGPARRVCERGQWAPEGIPFCGEFIIMPQRVIVIEHEIYAHRVRNEEQRTRYGDAMMWKNDKRPREGERTHA